MEEKELELYKKMRTSLQKSFIHTLNDILQEETANWNNLSLLKQTLYRKMYNTFSDDTARKIKEEIIRLRAMKKNTAEEVMAQDIANLIASEAAIPTCQNPFQWITNFRKNFLELNCFARSALFERLVCEQDLWDYDCMDSILKRDFPHLQDKDPNEQTQIMVSLVIKLNNTKDFINTNNQASDSVIEENILEDYIDTESGQLSFL